MKYSVLLAVLAAARPAVYALPAGSHTESADVRADKGSSTVAAVEGSTTSEGGSTQTIQGAAPRRPCRSKGPPTGAGSSMEKGSGASSSAEAAPVGEKPEKDKPSGAEVATAGQDKKPEENKVDNAGPGSEMKAVQGGAGADKESTKTGARPPCPSNGPEKGAGSKEKGGASNSADTAPVDKKPEENEADNSKLGADQRAVQGGAGAEKGSAETGRSPAARRPCPTKSATGTKGGEPGANASGGDKAAQETKAEDKDINSPEASTGPQAESTDQGVPDTKEPKDSRRGNFRQLSAEDSHQNNTQGNPSTQPTEEQQYDFKNFIPETKETKDGRRDNFRQLSAEDSHQDNIQGNPSTQPTEEQQYEFDIVPGVRPDSDSICDEYWIPLSFHRKVF
ncbi:hypothetical protein CDD83_3782 [Cordyceps sp. RAO-2017]|nr:hypothetical protein CDD83_3782 [Cordyceps sp. RAO-2017]